MLKLSNETFRRLSNIYIVISIGVLFALSVNAGMYLSIIVFKLLTFDVHVVQRDILNLLLALLYFFISILNLHFSPDIFEYLQERRNNRRIKDDY